jgi:hypothetical protein
MRLAAPPAWLTWLLIGVAVGLFCLIAYKAAERWLKPTRWRLTAKTQNGTDRPAQAMANPARAARQHAQW